MVGTLNSKYKNKYWTKYKVWCHEAVIRGYQAMLVNPAEFNQRKEETISAYLLHEMRKDEFLISNNISVKREHYLEDNEILSGGKEASEGNRIDFSFESTWQKEYITYFAEAKNLSTKDWIKKTDKTVKAWNQREYYLTTGIQGLIIGKYKQLEGFLIGYIVNGSAKQNLDNLNNHIQSRRNSSNIGLLEVLHPICGYPSCYISKNFRNKTQIDLQHIFLEFDKQAIIINKNI